MDNASTVTITTKQANASLFLQELKRDTAHQHTQLEQQELLSALMSPTVSVQQYCAYLLLMQQVMFAYEDAILPLVIPVLNKPSGQSAAAQIQLDVENTGYDLGREVPGKYQMPQSQVSISYALGFMYVIEGSKLGGKFIYKHINSTLGFTETNGAGYLANTGADTGKQWKAFLTSFSAYIVEHDAPNEAIEGSKEAFASIYKYFQNNAAHYAV